LAVFYRFFPAGSHVSPFSLGLGPRKTSEAASEETSRAVADYKRTLTSILQLINIQSNYTPSFTGGWECWSV